MPSKQNISKIGEWKAGNVDRIVFETRKEKQFPARIAQAVEAGKAKSRQAYIISAVDAALERDGYPAPDGAGEQPGD